MTERTSFRSVLKYYRQAAGLSQETLAARAGLSARAISDLERGINRTPRYDTLELLSSTLSLSSQQHALLQAAARPDVAAAIAAPQGWFASCSYPTGRAGARTLPCLCPVASR